MAEQCIKLRTVFEPSSSCPKKVKDEVHDLWIDNEMGNDKYIFKWESAKHGEASPAIDKFLKSKGITECWIHLWW